MAAQLPNVTIKFKVWLQSREHDRYFITDRGGLVFTNSYQEKPDDPNNRYEVHPLSVERLAELRIKYTSNNSELLEVGLLREVK